jgi:hypothetical protein
VGGSKRERKKELKTKKGKERKPVNSEGLGLRRKINLPVVC